MRDLGAGLGRRYDHKRQSYRSFTAWFMDRVASAGRSSEHETTQRLMGREPPSRKGEGDQKGGLHVLVMSFSSRMGNLCQESSERQQWLGPYSL